MNRRLVLIGTTLVTGLVLAMGCGSRTSVSRTAAPVVGASPFGEAARSNAPEQTPQQVVKLVTPSVVRVRVGGSRLGVFGSVAQQSSTGTGIVLDSEGHILTSNHVITSDSDRVSSDITVDFASGKSVPARLVGRDPTTDLAVLQIKASNLTPAGFVPAGSVVVGEPVLAIGYALNIEGTPTVTAGVVSALNRIIPETLRSSGGTTSSVQISGAVQTDAAINPGNSGGPLVNMRSEVVGINTASSGTSRGIFFAISSDVAQPIVKQLIAKGRIDRGYLGVEVQTLTVEAARSQQLPVTSGIRIINVTRNAPADRAGIRSGDVIVKLGARDIHSAGDLEQALALDPPGAKVDVVYYRDKNQRTVGITLVTSPPNFN